MCPKLTEPEALEYWARVHQEGRDRLAPVIFPDRSRLLNRFFDTTQRDAVGRTLDACRVPLLGKTTLDIGCGRGRWLRYFAQRGSTTQGVDVSAHAVQACLDAGFETRQEAAQSLSSVDCSFDLVTSITVLLHLPPQSQALAAKELARVCRAGGHILLLEPTRHDRAPHVWPRPLRGWISLFPDFDVVRLEGHYYAPLLRLLWASKSLRVTPRRWRSKVEDLVVLWGWPLEFGLMRLLRGRQSRLGLQHLILLRKRAPAVSAAGEPRSA
jgi:SAM-dependent methyltransferase